MANIQDYIRWRGDLPFSVDPPNTIDSLVFSVLVYIRFAGRAVSEPSIPIPLCEVAEEFFQQEDCKQRAIQKHQQLLQLAAASQRFGTAQMVRFRDRFEPEADTQFAAAAFLLDDGSLFVTFRGTDNTLVGWKEDFEMCFQQSVPSQRFALEYVRELYSVYGAPMYLCGHSKGGNLAVYAAAKSPPEIRRIIRDVYNNDGPGFTQYMMGDPGYLEMVPRIHTFVPQSSIIGLLMEHEEPYSIIKSDQVSVLQHDILTWEVMGKELIPVQELTADSKFLQATFQNWLRGMDMEERNKMVDNLFELLATGNVERAGDIFLPKNTHQYMKRISADKSMRQAITEGIGDIIEAAMKAGKPSELPEGPETPEAPKPAET